MASKITGMLIDFELLELVEMVDMINDDDNLQARISEAIEVLEDTEE